MLTTQAAVRAAFWRDLDAMGAPMSPGDKLRQERFADNACYQKGKRQNDYPVDVRMAFGDYVDMLARSGVISEALAWRVTL